MSGLWTPGGSADRPPDRGGGASGAATPNVGPDAVDPGAFDPGQREQAEAMAAEMAEVRRQLAEVPASMVVANHVMGLYELAAIHLSGQPARLDEARLAIDAVTALVEGLAGRLGDEEATLVDALNQLRLAFVQVRGAEHPGPAGPAPEVPGGDERPEAPPTDEDRSNTAG